MFAVQPKNTFTKKKLTYSRYGYYFIAPFFIVYFFFQLYPLLYTIFLSFTDNYTSNGRLIGPDFAGFKNYIYALNNPRVFGAFKNTVIMWIANFVPQISLSLLLAAWFTNTTLKIKGQGAYKILLFMPNIITAASIAVLFFSLFQYPIGPINSILQQLGIMAEPVNFLRSTNASRMIIAFILFWMWYGNTMIILIAGILGINPTFFEAAMVDGATNNQIFWKVTIPLIKPIMLYTLVTSLIGGLQMYDVPQLFNFGSPNYTTESITMYIYNQAFTGSLNYGRSAAVSVLLFIITAFFSLIIFHLLRDKDTKKARKVVR